MINDWHSRLNRYDESFPKDDSNVGMENSICKKIRTDISLKIVPLS